jgi:hypothetical protein
MVLSKDMNEREWGELTAPMILPTVSLGWHGQLTE